MSPQRRQNEEQGSHPNCHHTVIPNVPTSLSARSSGINKVNQASKNTFSSLTDSLEPDAAHTALTHLVEMRSYWSDLESTSSQVVDAKIILSFSHARIMLGHWLLWGHLHSTVAQSLHACYRHYQNNQRCSCWTRGLVLFVTGLYSSPKRFASVSFSRVFPNARLPNSASLLPANVTTNSSDLDLNMRRRVVHVCLSVLAQWLGLQPSQERSKAKPPVDLWDIRGGMIHILASMRKPGLFLLEEVYKLFLTPVPYVFSKQVFINGRVLPSVIQECLLYTADKNDALSNSSAALEHCAPDIFHSVMSSQPMEALPSLPSLPGADVFVRTARNLICSASTLNAQSSNAQHKWILAKDDQRNPLRENAQSRSIFVQDPHITPDFLRTRAGLFSLIVFRAITFNSSFLFEQQLVAFDSLQEWKDAVEGLPEGDVCNMLAYGQAMGGRSSKKASSYWEKTSEWESWLQKNPEPSFEDMHSFIADCNFSQVGDLTCILATEDLYYGEVCSAPDLRLFAHDILKMKKGAYKALNAFNVLPNTDPNFATCDQNVDSFLNVFQALQNELELTDDEALVPDIIIFEHLCCKVYRAWLKNMLTYE